MSLIAPSKTTRRNRIVVKAAAAAVALPLAVLGVAACSDNDSSSSASSSAMSGSEGMPGANDAMGDSKPQPVVPSTSIATPDGQNVEINDPGIIAAYAARGYEKGYLGKPLGPVAPLREGGKFITFEHGSLYLNPKTQKAYAVHGAIGGYWGSKQHENGPLGYPTGDETKADGGLEQTFDGGTLVFKDGKVTEKQ